MKWSDYVDALYRLTLGHPVDPEGARAWSEFLESGGDPTRVLRDLLDSEGHRLRVLGTEPPDCALLAKQALASLGRRPRIVDVGAQADGGGRHIYSPLLELTEVEVVGFDPLRERLQQRMDRESPRGVLTLIPCAIGDGMSHTLFINNDDATSSLLPLNREVNAQYDYLSSLHTVRTVKVDTKRLDDVLSDDPIDLLKIDVQGSELMVLQNAQETLKRTSVVQCEVEFAALYEKQPLYPELDKALVAADFELIDFIDLARRWYVSVGVDVAPDRLLWADAIYFRKTTSKDMLRSQALIAAAVYAKPSLSARLIKRAGSAD